MTSRNSFSRRTPRGLFFILLTLFAMNTYAQPKAPADVEEIRAAHQCLMDFAQAADKQDLQGLDNILHKEYRSVLNKAFGSDDTMILTKDAYIQMAKDGKIGGSEREVHVLSLDVENHIAKAKVVLLSPTMKFTSFFSMVKNAEGQWQMVEDLPVIEKL